MDRKSEGPQRNPGAPKPENGSNQDKYTTSADGNEARLDRPVIDLVGTTHHGGVVVFNVQLPGIRLRRLRLVGNRIIESPRAYGSNDPVIVLGDDVESSIIRAVREKLREVRP